VTTPLTVAVDPDEFAGQIALVTAAAGRGIGQAIARRLAAGGASVVVTDIHPGRTHDVSAAIAADYPKATVVGYPLDAGDRDQIDAVVDEVTATLGPIRILVNNAALNVIGSIFDYDAADWDRVVRVNLTGAWYLCRRTMPLMRDAGGGVIVNVGSYAPDVGGGGIEAPYAATKGGVSALTRGLAARMASAPCSSRWAWSRERSSRRTTRSSWRGKRPPARSATCRTPPTSQKRLPSSHRSVDASSRAKSSTCPVARTCATDRRG
jgi:NADP-dependent 3-hydroxy acid dehydrogenase YdfG